MKDTHDVGPGGIIISARLQSVSEQAAEDIKRCSNTCETYSKKRSLVKVLTSLSWKEKLLEFVTIFAQRREEFQTALSIHVARKTDSIHSAVSDIGTTMESINQR